MDDLEIISGTAQQAVYKLNDLSMLTDKAVKEMKWPDGLRSKMFVVTGETGAEQEILGALAEKGAVWGLYSADRAGLVQGTRVPSLPSVRARTIKKPEELERLYTETREGWYRSRNEAMTPRQTAETKDFVERFLPESRYLYLEKSGKRAGLLMLNEYVDYRGRPADLIPWVWVESSLDQDARRVVHAAMAAWLGENVSGRVQAYVASSNLRSQKFFRKLGFRLEAVRVLGEK